MKKSFLPLLLAAILLLGTCANAEQAEEKMGPPTGALVVWWDSERRAWDYWIDDVETSILLFMDTGAVMVSDTGNEKHLQIASAAYPDVAFELAFYRRDALKGQNLLEQSDEQLTMLALEACLNGSELVGMTGAVELTEGFSVLRARTVAEEIYSDYTLMIHDGWLVSICAIPSEPNGVVSEDVVPFSKCH